MGKSRPRYIEKAVRDDLTDSMVFVGGPRQVGKTTFALGLLDRPSASHPAYLNWDDVSIRQALTHGELPASQRLLVFDEIHKYARWRNLLKGFFDTREEGQSIVVTGSARLDYYAKGGDSLQGRYYYHRLHPLSLAEMGGAPSSVEPLMRFGGFPEPLLKADERFWRRWQLGRSDRVIHEDIRDLETVREISLLELMSHELPNRVGAPLSVKNLADQLQVSPKTADRWVRIFARLYVVFLLAPFGGRRIRAVKKEQKLYLWDWSQVPRSGPRFENLVGSHLLKYCHHLQDTEGHQMELRYLRDTDKREVDFVVLKDGAPVFAVEAKSGDKAINPAVHYFNERTEIPAFYQVHLGTRDYLKAGVRVLPFHVFSKEIGLV
jgi:predicted AAA+ superfamily ATPase